MWSSFRDFDSGVNDGGSENLGTHSTHSSVKEKIFFASSCAIASDFGEFSIGIKAFSGFQKVIVDSLEGEGVILGIASAEFGNVFIADIEGEVFCSVASQFLFGESDLFSLFGKLDKLFVILKASV
jgi:hypothetical protein